MSEHIRINSEISTLKDGFYQIDKDLLALNLFLEEVQNLSLSFKTYDEKLLYLIENDFYENFYQIYSKEEIKKIRKLIESEKFQFKSYMSAKKFYQDYALKTDDKKIYLENYEDRVTAVSLFLGRGNSLLAQKIATSIIKQCYQPATPTFLNAGRKRRGEMVSCFLLQMDDSLNSISFNLGCVMYLSKIGGGVAINLSKLRSRGESIKGVKNTSKGVVPILKLLEDSFNYADQMGQRKGAGAAYLNIFHSDIEEFLDTKKINADEKSRIQTLSLGIVIPDKFFELAQKNETFYVFSPLSVFKEFGKHLDDMEMDVYYERLVSHPAIVKRELNAREMLTNIAKLQFESGYPYLIFIDQANRVHPLKDLGRISMSNLCTEIFQLQTLSTIHDYEKPDEIGYDISCVLGSLNLVNVVEGKNIRESVHAGVEALTSVSDMTNVVNAPSVKEANKKFHSIGLGTMNLHGLLAKNRIGYESEEAIDIVSTLFMMINYFSLEKSMLISKEKKESFFGFDKSEYKKGTYFQMYIDENFLPKTDIAKALFSEIEIPTQEDWKKLKEEVQKYGLCHAYRLAIAPTQSISYVQNSTQSILPIVDMIETRTYGNSTTYYPAPYLSRENSLFFKVAYQTDMYKLIDLVSEVQRHVDQGISCILYVDSETSTKALVRLYLYAHRKGLKSLYYTRNKNLSLEECIACSV